MRYRHNWNSMTEIVWDVMDGNTVRVAERQQEPAREQKVIQMDNFRPKQKKHRKTRRRAIKRYQRAEEVARIRLALQCIVMTVMVTLICLLDGANLQQTTVLMTSIIGCGAVMILLDDTKNER